MAWLTVLAAGLFETGFAVALKQSHGMTRSRDLADLIRRIASISPLIAIVTPNASSNPAQGLSSKARKIASRAGMTTAMA